MPLRSPMRPLVVLALLLAPVAAVAQPVPRGSVEQRLRELERQIASDQDRLTRALEAEQVTLGTLSTLDREIATRDALVATYGLRASQLLLERDSLGRTLAALSNDLVRLRARQRALAVHAYKRGRLHDLALLFSSRSITEMVRRARLLKRLSEQRRRQNAALEAATAALTERQRQIAVAQREAQRTYGKATDEQQDLLSVRARRSGVVAQLRAQRSSLEADLAAKRAAAEGLEREIRRLVAEETARSRTASPADNAAAAALAAEFAENRGRLPWPAAGVVTEPFGEIVNRELGTRTPNPGVTIATEGAAAVTAVFGGTVARVDVMPEYGTFVLVQHGGFQSLYANLSAVAVERGQTVRAGGPIGRAGTDRQPRGRAVFFALFRQGTPVNPLQWLRGR